jgi:hypothetical protein
MEGKPLPDAAAGLRPVRRGRRQGNWGGMCPVCGSGDKSFVRMPRMPAYAFYQTHKLNFAFHVHTGHVGEKMEALAGEKINAFRPALRIPQVFHGLQYQSLSKIFQPHGHLPFR